MNIEYCCTTSSFVPRAFRERCNLTFTILVEASAAASAAATPFPFSSGLPPAPPPCPATPSAGGATFCIPPDPVQSTLPHPLPLVTLMVLVALSELARLDMSPPPPPPPVVIPPGDGSESIMCCTVSGGDDVLLGLVGSGKVYCASVFSPCWWVSEFEQRRGDVGVVDSGGGGDGVLDRGG